MAATRLFARRCLISFIGLLLISASWAQAPAGGNGAKDIKDFPGLPAEFAALFGRLQHEVQFPSARSESHLMPILPQSTLFYLALPNYGDAAHQALQIFRDQRQQRPVLRDWWKQQDSTGVGSKFEDMVENLHLLSQYLGDEVVIAAAMDTGGNPKFVILSEIKKSGLKAALQQMKSSLGGSGLTGLRVIGPEELNGITETKPHAFTILITPNLFVAAPDVETLRAFNAAMTGTSARFVSTDFGQKLQRAYQDRVSVVAGIDLHTLISKAPMPAAQGQVFDKTGFADVKYLIWQHKDVAGAPASQAELSFNGPRQGIAAWLAAPRRLGSLDFVSAKAFFASTIVLNDMPRMLDDIRNLANASNPNAFAMADQMQAFMGVDLKTDVLRYLEGEITFEVDRVQPEPVWKSVVQVNDWPSLQQSLSKLLASSQTKERRWAEGGVTYHAVTVPSTPKSRDIVYAFSDGYLVVGSSAELVEDGIRAHKTGESLAKSPHFLAAMPPGPPLEASGLLYEDPVAIATMNMAKMSPEVARSFAQVPKGIAPAVICAYAEPTSIREASANAAVDAGVVMVMAAIAIPNFVRAKSSADQMADRTPPDERAAVASLRRVVAAQTNYSSTYPSRGYARDLAALGTDLSKPGPVSADHAGLIDRALGCSSGLCVTSGYRFRLAAVCKENPCEDFVAVATPANSSARARSFCATSDGLLRFKINPPPDEPAYVSECQGWTLLPSR